MNMQLRPGTAARKAAGPRGEDAYSATLDLAIRMRRNRRTDWSRRLVREHKLSVDDLIWPVFVIEGEGRRESVASMPGVERLSIDELLRETEEAAKLAIPAIALFPNIDASLRDEDGSEGLKADNLICRAIAAIKARFPQIGVMADVALDPYTSHGHDGLMRGEEILNDLSVGALIRQALVQAHAGCDIIAPSDMMDGRVGAIRRALDDEGFGHVQIMAYAAKYASAFYAMASSSMTKPSPCWSSRRCCRRRWAATSSRPPT